MKYLIYCSILFLSFNFLSCNQQTEYERLVQKELDSGQRYDSLFLGYELGMKRQEFFDHSWELNQQNKITGDTQVRYKLNQLSKNATMTFYPEFKNDRIIRLPAEVSFDSWAIWNRELYADSLIVELIDMFEDMYGPGFIRTLHPELNKEAWIKVDGNRRISVYEHDNMKARVEFLDLTAE